MGAVLVLGAAAGGYVAERATIGHTVPGLGTYKNPQTYCLTRDTRLTDADSNTTADVITIYQNLGGAIVPYSFNMHSQRADFASMNNSDNLTIDHLRLCWAPS